MFMQLTETHINALIAYGERCNTHFITFKDNMMKENLFLVEMLMCGSYKTPSSSNVGTTRSHQGPATGQLEGRMFPPKVDMGSIRGYESSSEGKFLKIRNVIS
jgi:hypothetical protein